MPYYPKSQIKTNLYAESGKFVKASDNTPYVGYYWQTSQGEYWSGKTPQDIPTIKLIPFFDPENSVNFPQTNLINFDVSTVVSQDLYYNPPSTGNSSNYQIIPLFFQTPPYSTRLRDR